MLSFNKSLICNCPFRKFKSTNFFGGRKGLLGKGTKISFVNSNGKRGGNRARRGGKAYVGFFLVFGGGLACLLFLREMGAEFNFRFTFSPACAQQWKWLDFFFSNKTPDAN